MNPLAPVTSTSPDPVCIPIVLRCSRRASATAGGGPASHGHGEERTPGPERGRRRRRASLRGPPRRPSAPGGLHLGQRRPHLRQQVRQEQRHRVRAGRHQLARGDHRDVGGGHAPAVCLAGDASATAGSSERSTPARHSSATARERGPVAELRLPPPAGRPTSGSASARDAALTCSVRTPPGPPPPGPFPRPRALSRWCPGLRRHRRRALGPGGEQDRPAVQGEAPGLAGD